MYYYLSIGTNIHPEKNAANIVKKLSAKFGPIVIYPFIYTQPEQMDTKNRFLNSVAIVCSNMDKGEVKQILNQIEIDLGRDRNDPDKSIKDRTADIDILGSAVINNNNFFSIFQESYIRNVIIEDFSGVDLGDWGLPTTQGATTVNFDSTTGHISVINNTHNSLIDR